MSPKGTPITPSNISTFVYRLTGYLVSPRFAATLAPCPVLTTDLYFLLWGVAPPLKCVVGALGGVPRTLGPAGRLRVPVRRALGASKCLRRGRNLKGEASRWPNPNGG